MSILRNRARCKLCQDVVESLTRYDFSCCSCLALCVAGGWEYIKRSINLPSKDLHDTDYMHEYVEELSEFTE